MQRYILFIFAAFLFSQKGIAEPAALSIEPVDQNLLPGFPVDNTAVSVNTN